MEKEILYFDCATGISGDMTVGALLDLGIEEDVFKQELAKLELGGYKVKISKKEQGGVLGTDFQVLIDDRHHHRKFSDIKQMIDESKLDSFVKRLSYEIFLEIAVAEARVHGEKVEDVHFHEVGAIDSIIDIVGTAICLNLLGNPKVYSSALHDGYGHIECRHGIIPVPVPAVKMMLENTDIPLIPEDIPTELVTPTGMAIIKTIAKGFGQMPQMTIEKAGFGLGKRQIGRLNALRVLKGQN